MVLPSPYFEGTPEGNARRVRAEERWDECMAEYSQRYAQMFLRNNA